jgi:hypothetical protein
MKHARFVRTLVTFTLFATSLPGLLLSQSGIVISQVYGGGGNQGASYRNDFVELFNRSGQSVNLAGWTIQYASATGSFWVKTELSGTVQPGQYYLVQEEQGNGGFLSLPNPDASGGIGLSASSGKVALVQSTTNLSGAFPTRSDIVDLVGYGDATYSLGSPAPELTNITAASRSGNGCTDTRNNGANFTIITPSPRNRQSALNPCVASCVFSLSSNTANLSLTGGQISLTVSTSASCSWTTSNLASWITITAGTSGLGTGTVSLSIAANPSIQSRSSIVTIAGRPFTVTQTPGLRFVPLPPCRLMETRAEYNFENRTGAFGPPFLQAGLTRTLTLANSTVCGVPAQAKAYVLNVTAIPRGPLDYVTIYPSGSTLPNFWTLRSPDGQIVANSAIVASGAGAINIFTSNDTDMLLDISGYFTDAIPGGENLVYYPLSPCRVIETRTAYRPETGQFGPPSMAAGSTRRFRFPQSPHCSIPPGASAYSMTLTVVPPQPLSYMTLWPAGAAQPNVSSINSFAGRVLANNTIVPAGADGSIDVFAAGQTDFIVDINGYFAPDNGQGLYYFPLTQCRAQDSTLYADNSTRTINVPSAGNCTGIPSNAKGYTMNVTAIPGGSGLPFVTVYPSGQLRPNASILNAFEGQTVTGGGIIPTGLNGAIDVYAFLRTNLVVDVSGYFGR